MEPSLAATPAPAKPTLPAVLAGLGGLLVAVAGFLTWFDLTNPQGSVAIKGNDLSVGVGSAAVGVFVAVTGLIVFLRGPQTGARAWSITGIVLSGILVILAGAASFAPETALTQWGASEVSDNLGISETQAEAALESAFNAGTLDAKAAIGSFVALGGALLALAGSIIGTVTAKRMRQQPPAAPPPPEAPPPV